MKKIFILFALLTCWLNVTGQSINGPQFVCPNKSYSFKFSNPLACDQFKWTVSGGKENTDYEILNGKTSSSINIKFYDNVTIKLILKITNDGTIDGTASNECTNHNNNTSYELIVQSAYGSKVTPIKQSGAAKCGSTEPISFEVEPHYGAGYNWNIPSGWTINSNDLNKITVTPNGKNGGLVSVDVFFDADWLYYQGCIDNSTSEYHHPLVQKNVPFQVPTLSGIVGPESIAKGDKSPITYAASPALSNVIYHWTIPCGWTGPNGETESFSTTTPTVALTPSGYRVGDVTVKASFQCSGSSMSSNTVSKNVKFEGGTTGFSMYGFGTVCYSQSSTFSLTPAPAPGAKVIWTKSSNLAYVSGQGTGSFKVKAASSSTRGEGWVRVSVSDECGTFPIMTKTLWVGPPDQAHKYELFIQGFRGTNPVSLTTDAAYVFQLDPVKGASSYRWVLPRGFSFMEGFGTNSYVAKIWTSSVGGQYQIKCYPQNGCGSDGSGYQSITVYLPGGSGGGGGGGDPICPRPPCQIPQPIRVASASELPEDQPVEFKAYPNPADSYINVDLPYLKNAEDNAEESIVRIYDQKQHEIVSRKFQGTENHLRLSVSDLPCGIYILSVVRGGESYIEKIYIK